MILTDHDILASIDAGDIIISNFDQSRLGPNSYDLLLGDTLLEYYDGILDCAIDNPTFTIPIPREGYVLKPGHLYLGCTHEKTTVKKHAPDIEGKSSIGRLGISIHATAGVGDIGFSGYWTLEISSIRDVRIYRYMPIAQIRFLVPSGPCLNPYNKRKGSKYADQPGRPVASAMHKNFPLKIS